MSIQTLPNKGQIQLTTDNWTDFLNKNSNSKNKSGNVQSKDFDWMFFAGIANKEEFKKLKVSYSRASSFIEKMYDMEQQKLRKFIKQYEKNDLFQEIIIQSFKNIKKVLENINADEGIKKVFFNVTMSFYMENYRKNIFFVEGEEYLLILCYKIAEFVAVKDKCKKPMDFCEPFTFLLYKAFLMNCKLKSFYFPNIKLKVGEKIYKFYKKKDISRPHFFCFLIVYMFMKVSPTVVSDLFKEKNIRKKQFFNEFIEAVFNFFIFNLPFKVGLTDTLNDTTREIFATVLKKKDPLVLAIYILAYFKNYLPENLKVIFPSRDEEVTHLKKIVDEYETTGRSDTLQADKKNNPENPNALLKRLTSAIGFSNKNKKYTESHIIKQPIPNKEIEKLEKYFKSNLSKIAKTAKKKIVKKDNKISFNFPEKLVKKPVLQSGGNFKKTRKNIKKKKNISFKTYYNY